MALAQVNPIESKPQRPSALDTAAKMLGVVANLGGALASGYGAVKNAGSNATQANAMQSMLGKYDDIQKQLQNVGLTQAGSVGGIQQHAMKIKDVTAY